MNCNISINDTMQLRLDSTVISKDKQDYELVATSVTDIKYLESLRNTFYIKFKFHLLSYPSA